MTSIQKATETKSAAQTPAGGMMKLLKTMEKSIVMALPAHMSSDRFQRVALSAFSGSYQLQQCTPSSFIAAMMQSAQLGLEPNTPLGQAYLIPYGDKVQFQLGYQGYIDLCYRTGLYSGIGAYEVHENDEFDLEYGLNMTVKHKPCIKGDRGAVIGYYGYYRLKDGGDGVFYMTKSEAEQWGRKFSKTYNKGPWQTDFDAMAKKTVLKQALKYAPKSIELSRQLATDATVKDEVQKDMADVEPVVWAEATEASVEDSTDLNVDETTGEVHL